MAPSGALEMARAHRRPIVLGLALGILVLCLHNFYFRAPPPLVISRSICAIQPFVTSLANTSIPVAMRRPGGPTHSPRPADGYTPGMAPAIDDGRYPIPIMDMDAIKRCGAMPADANRIPLSVCRNSSQFDIRVLRYGFSATDSTLFEVVVRTSVREMGPISGAMLVGTLQCMSCASRVAAWEPAPVQAFAYSRDNCDGTYLLLFEGIFGVTTEAQRWSLQVRLDYVNYEQYVSAGRLCSRTLSSLIRFIPDGQERCGILRYYFTPFSDFSIVRSTPAFRPDVVERDVVAKVAAMPVCPGLQRYNASGRWLMRPPGPADASFCRAGASPESTELWLPHDDYVWCPYDCRLRFYSRADIRTCAERRGIRNVLLAGDSRMQNTMFDLGHRFKMGVTSLPKNTVCSKNPLEPCSFEDSGVTFDLMSGWGFFDGREPECIPPKCAYEELNPDQYFLTRTRGKNNAIPQLLRRLSAKKYDVFVLSEGIHLLQHFFSAEDFDVLIRSILNAVLNHPNRPRYITYSTSAASIDVNQRSLSGSRDSTQVQNLNRLAIRALREMVPDGLVLDQFALTVTRGRDRFYDGLHFFPVGKNIGKCPLTVGRDSNLLFFNILCND